MDFLGFVGCSVIYLSEYLIQSYITVPAYFETAASGYITMPPSTTSTCPVM
jgi:hypothetical protein